jgi:hypothetical protein
MEDKSNGTMKTLADGTLVSSRGYYYLLDWNEQDQWKFILRTFDANRLCDLNIEQYRRLFKHATENDLNKL